uniref:Integrase catalytic domain-containing protein n=1 Tax=Panagrolaimus davidi TaxID=227884 RepID=A0A914Q890_9BILA
MEAVVVMDENSENNNEMNSENNNEMNSENNNEMNSENNNEMNSENNEMETAVNRKALEEAKEEVENVWKNAFKVEDCVSIKSDNLYKQMVEAIKKKERNEKFKREEKQEYNWSVRYVIKKKSKILQTDNGREFKNSTVGSICEKFGVKFIHDTPRHSQSQGSIERSNLDVENILQTMMADNKTSKWVSLLQQVQLAKNKRSHKALNFLSPYEVHFGRKLISNDTANAETEDNPTVPESEVEQAAAEVEEIIESHFNESANFQEQASDLFRYF